MHVNIDTDAIGATLAALLNGRHVGDGVVEFGDTSLTHPRAAYGEIVAVVDPDTGSVVVSILWRDDDGNMVTIYDLTEDVPHTDTDAIVRAVSEAR
jgi:hypothetical protein